MSFIFLFLGLYVWFAFINMLSMSEVIDMSEESVSFHEEIDKIQDFKVYSPYKAKLVNDYLKVAEKRRETLDQYTEKDFKRIYMFMTFRIRKGFPELPVIDKSRL